VQTLVQRMKAAADPAKPGVRRLTLTLSQDQETVQVTVGEARKQVNGEKRILLTTLAPAGVQGTSYLVQEGGPGQDTQWFYLPYVRRVRKLVSPEAYSAFLNSDFTYADLGFVDTGATYTLLGEGPRAAKDYRCKPCRRKWYYAWVTTIDADTGMPIMREIYDWPTSCGSANAGTHHGRDGVSLPGDVSMEDLRAVAHRRTHDRGRLRRRTRHPVHPPGSEAAAFRCGPASATDAGGSCDAAGSLDSVGKTGESTRTAA
jgi:hypothetical protein